MEACEISSILQNLGDSKKVEKSKRVLPGGESWVRKLVQERTSSSERQCACPQVLWNHNDAHSEKKCPTISKASKQQGYRPVTTVAEKTWAEFTLRFRYILTDIFSPTSQKVPIYARLQSTCSFQRGCLLAIRNSIITLPEKASFCGNLDRFQSIFERPRWQDVAPSV